MRVKPFSDKHVNPTVRLTLDYHEDFLLIKKIIEFQENQKDDCYSLDSIVRFLSENGEAISINWHLHAMHLSRSRERLSLKYLKGDQLVNLKY